MDKIPEAARSAFEDFLSRRDRGEALDLDDYCAARPELAAGIKLLHSLHASGGDSRLEPGTAGDGDGEGAGAGAAMSSLQSRRLERLGPGTTVGPYRLVRQIGSGGMGAVFLAEQERPVRRQVALKVIKLGMDTREVVARFEAERQALALMEHPHIATVLDAGATEDGRPYFVMEHVPGVPITEHCDRHELGMAQRLSLFLQVCEAVQHAHQKGIIHRDLKPSNVLVALRGEEAALKVIDFGVAKAISQRLTERSVFTEIGQIVGTPEYMSPEQAEMSELDIDTRSDIYSLGVVLYELLVGALPFDPRRLRQGGYAAIQRIIREEEPLKPSTRITRQGKDSADAARKRRTDPRSLLHLLRGDLDWITMKAMAKDRTQRYASASELAADIRRHLRHEPVLAGPPGAAYRVRKLVRRHRVQLAVAAVVALLLAGISAATWHLSSSRAREERLHTSEAHFREGQDRAAEYRRLRDALPALKQRWQEARARHELWEPVWERDDELAAWDALQRSTKELPEQFTRADVALSNAREIAPAGSDVAREVLLALESLYMDGIRDADRQEVLRSTPDRYKTLVASLGIGTYAKELDGGGRIAIETVPTGAEVYCFRYEEREQRLVPLPFDPVRGKAAPADGLLGGPILLVETAADPTASPFLPGDRLLRVRDRPVALPGDVARLLKQVAAGERIAVSVLRSREALELEWVPFSREAPADGTIDFRERFGLAFAGYPLDFVAGCRAGTTGEGVPVQIDLPRGSYLLVCRRDGRRDTRLPVAIPGATGSIRVHLPEESAIPPGFVHVPAGAFAYGGDAGAFRSLEAGEQRLDDFFIGRFEVTVREYLDFVNDPEVLAATDARGEAAPFTDDVRRELELVFPQEPSKRRVWLIPKKPSGDPRWERSGGGAWRLPADSNWKDTWPMLDVTHLAALEHAAWRSRRETGPWRYRLPTDLEWEKAARGADRRFHVWGNYMVWSFCWSFDRPGKAPAPVGVSPLDESVHGVRDMAGSVNEHTTGQPVARFRYRSLRGGGWSIIDEESYRIATRNSRYPERSETQTGFRLVVESK